jgi:predicted dehydrogenase
MRVGVIGVGVAGSSHLFDLASSDKFDLVAVCSRRHERAVEAAALYGAPLAYDNPHAMLAEADLDGVVIATPPDATPAILRMTLAAGLPALVDKPGAPSAALLDAVKRDAREATARTAVAYNRRYQSHIQHARELLAREALGAVAEVHCTWTGPFRHRYTGGDTYRRQARWGQGVVLDTASHIIDTLAHLGFAPLEVRHARLTPGRSGADIEADIDLYRQPDGIPISIEITDNNEGENWTINVRGSDGHAHLTRTELAVRHGRGQVNAVASDLRRPVDDLLDLASGRGAYGATLDEAITVLRVIDQVRTLAGGHGRPWLRPRAKALGRLNGAC